MKRIPETIIAVILAMLLMTIMPAQVFADSMPEYISEVKVFYDNVDGAEGYTILCDANGNPVDLNQNAGGGWGSKGEKAVYLGYKTTTDAKDAITDLALMNMKGGYSVEDYKALMDTQLHSQIIPFVESFLSAIREYRENYASSNPGNKQRADYVHDMLNKLTDDDCGGAGLGDLLLNKTKYEMGIDAYNKLSPADKEKTSPYEMSNKVYDALSENERNEHADILTIIAQSNGKATLLIETLLVRASDTNDSNWLERFAGLTYDDMIEMTGYVPTDAERELSKLYDDDANEIMEKWDDFRNVLLNYDKDVETLENFDEDEINSALEAIDSLTENTPKDEADRILDEYSQAQEKLSGFTKSLRRVALHDLLDEQTYGDSTMLEFFTRESAEVYDDITSVYPLVAAFSAGQRAGLEFVSLEELFMICFTDPEGYNDDSVDALEAISVYTGVDRAIYDEGGVALTSDSLRKDAAAAVTVNDDGKLSNLSIAMMVVSGVTFGGILVSVGTIMGSTYRYNRLFDIGHNVMCGAENISRLRSFSGFTEFYRSGGTIDKFIDNYYETVVARNAVCTRLAIGFTVAFVIFSAITVVLTWQDMKEYYKVDFTPIPNYMVDEKDIVSYNSKGEMIVLKNQSAYYKAVECNRTANAEFYGVLGTKADMNGDVGKQWLALYSNKNELGQPILAGSLTAVVGSTDIPSGYTTGIHMFGSDAAFHLNTGLYDWNNSAPAVFVYYRTDDSKASTAGTTFTGGTLALTGGAGLAIGALVTAFAMKPKKKGTEA